MVAGVRTKVGCSPSEYSEVLLLLQGGGGLRGGIISPWDTSQRVYFACSPEFAVGNFAPTCCEPTFGWWWLLLLTDALQLSPRGLSFLPDELLVAGCCYFMVVVVISWWLLVFSDALLLPFHPCKAQHSALRPLNKGCNEQLKNCFRWLQLTIAAEKKLAGVHKNS